MIRSAFPSALRSAETIDDGILITLLMSACENPPAPLPSMIVKGSPTCLFATAKSGLPSLLKSPPVITRGLRRVVMVAGPLKLGILQDDAAVLTVTTGVCG